MNILYCGDSNIADGVLMSVMSIAEHSREQLNIYLLTADVKTEEKEFFALDDSFAERLDTFIKQKNGGSVTLFNITELFLRDPPTANLATRFTPCCMLRLYADMLPLPNRILYLDNDVICTSDPSELFSLDIADNELAGVLDYYGSHFFRRRSIKRDYLNSGVLLLNLSAIKSSGLFARCRERCREKKMFMPDQSAINKLSGRVKILPRRFNEQRRQKGDTVFRHFTTSFRFFPYIRTVSAKPWDIERVHAVLKTRSYDELYEKFTKVKKELHI